MSKNEDELFVFKDGCRAKTAELISQMTVVV